MISIRIWYSSSSLFKSTKSVKILKCDLLFKLALHTIHMDTLTNLEDILRKRCVYDEDLPGTRDESGPEERGYNVDDTNVENNQVGGVAPEEPWHHLLLEKEKAESFTVVDVVFHELDFLLDVGVGRGGETLTQGPVIVGHVVRTWITLVV